MFQIELGKFDFLRKTALKMGAVDVKVITADKVVVEDRIVLKCKVGCVVHEVWVACISGCRISKATVKSRN